VPDLPQVRGVILDVDGTLVDSNDAHARAWAEALQEAGFDVPFERVRPLIGMGGDKLLPEVTGLPEEDPRAKRAGERRGEIFKARCLPSLRPFPRTRELGLRMRQAGLKLAVASSAEPEELKALLRLAGVDDLVVGASSADDAGASKPDPDVVHAALGRLALEPAHAVMIGDTPYDVEAAARAGVRAIAFRSPAGGTTSTYGPRSRSMTGRPTSWPGSTRHRSSGRRSRLPREPSNGGRRSGFRSMPRPFRALAALAVVALFLGRCATLPAGLGPDRMARVAAILEEEQGKEHIPGLAFVAVRDDRVIVRHTLGQRDRARDLPVTPDTRFPIGSCTKAFTAMAVAASQDAGLLSLDDSPHHFLPYFRMADPDADARVTLRDMLSHQTGLKAYADLAAEPGVLTREQYLRVALSARPVAGLRSRFQYSNAMYTAAGEVLAAVHGQPWEAVIERTLLRPLGMSRSVASIMSAPADLDQAVGYEYRPETADWEAVRPPVSLSVLAPAGSMGSTANDMARWLRFLTAGGAIDGRRVVSEASLREVTRPHVAINDTLSYGLGWAVYRWNGHTVVEHNGGSRGISAVMSFIPERRAGFAFLANTSPNSMTRIGNAGRRLWPVLLGEEARPEASPSSPVATPAAPVAPPPPGLPTAGDLIARVVAALGGEENLRRHRSMEVRGTKTYENQGVTADVVVLAADPDRRTEEETWTADGTRIGAIRVFFDGERGGQETTFGQDEMYAGEENEQARRDAAFRPWLGPLRGAIDVRLQRTASVDGEETYVLQRAPASGPPVSWHVSTRTGRVLQVDTAGKTTTFEDYRDVDGESVPFRTTSAEDLGEVVVQVAQVRFNVELPAGAFAPRRTAARP